MDSYNCTECGGHCVISRESEDSLDIKKKICPFLGDIYASWKKLAETEFDN
jgi:hypothetical protein